MLAGKWKHQQQMTVTPGFPCSTEICNNIDGLSATKHKTWGIFDNMSSAVKVQ